MITKRASAIIIVVVAFAAGVALIWPECAPRSIPFDSAQWKAGDARLRGKMVRELPGSTLLFGKDEEQVLQILGKPDDQSQTKWGYRVDTGAKFLDRHWLYYLTLTFCSNKVTNVELRD